MDRTAPLAVRAVGPDLAPALALLWARADARRRGRSLPRVAEPDLQSHLRGRLAQSGAVVVAGYVQDRLLTSAFASPAVDPDGALRAGVAHVSLVAVEPAYWGRGHARSTLADLLRRLRVAGAHSAQLCVLEDNDRARALYEREGWALDRVGLAHPDGPQALYTRELPDVP